MVEPDDTTLGSKPLADAPLDDTHLDAALTEAQRQERAEQHAAIERQRAADEALVRALAKDDSTPS